MTMGDRSALFTVVLTYDDLQAEEEESSLPHMDGGRGGGAFHGKLPPGILPHGLPQVKDVQPAQTPLEQQKEEKKKEGTNEYHSGNDPKTT